MYTTYLEIRHDHQGRIVPQPTTKSTLDFEEPSESNDPTWLWVLVIPFVFLFLVAGVGPWYHDCGHPDNCSTQRDYGLYCDSHCVYGHYGLGHSSGIVFFVLLFALFWFSSSREW